MNRLAIIGAGVALFLLYVVGDSAFIVDQTSQALVLQFGNPVRLIQQPGLKFKLPFVQSVVIFDRRVLDFEPDAEEVIAADQKRLVIDSFVRYRISDPLLFYRTVGNEEAIEPRLDATVSAAMRQVVGDILLNALLSPDRGKIMANIRDAVHAESLAFGIDVIDVRIRHSDLPAENSEAIYARMQSERQREAKQFRAEGYEIAQGIRADADRQRTVILAEANRQASVLHGQGDAQSIQIYADAYNQDPTFYAFYRSLQAYQTAFSNDTTLVLSPNSEFFRYFEPKKGAGPASADNGNE